ncbi:hypothetical protein BDZ89DRAFT_1132088 [Hymenopellis radicata]|nr:hypothetical protein BDZ89DRAFT_1132088 [Hymenopellis radicata]
MSTVTTTANTRPQSVLNGHAPHQAAPLSPDASNDGVRINKAFIDAPPMDRDTPSNFIPGLYVLGSTYNVLNGNYADSKSALQPVVDWNKSDVRIQEFGGKNYSIPEIANFSRNTTSDYRASYGKTMSEYTQSLSFHAGFEASFPGFSASASADYSESQRENLSNAFTRVTYAVTHYNLSLPPTSYIKSYLKPWFVDDLDNKDPIEFFREYGTHLLRSLVVGGRALFLYSTDTRSYSSELSLEAAAKISASYLVASGSIELTAKQREAMESFNESSETAVVTKGGDPRYGNEDFLKNVEAWAASIVDYPEFVDFGSLPSFTGLWEFASTPARRDVLQQAYTTFIKLYAKDLTLPGPFVRARFTQALDTSKTASMSVAPNHSGHINLTFPANRVDEWYYITPGAGTEPSIIISELVSGALAPVKWEEIFVAPFYSSKVTRFWKAIPPTPDYVAMGCVAMTGTSASAIPSQPPAALAGRFRAVHKSALTQSKNGVYGIYHSDGPRVVYAVDYRYWFADVELPFKEDCLRLDPKGAVLEGSGW